jgi:hypothetical protein
VQFEQRKKALRSACGSSWVNFAFQKMAMVKDLREHSEEFAARSSAIPNDLSGTLRLTNLVPPDPGFGRAIPHRRQFLLDLQQAACAHIGSRLLNGAVHALPRIKNIHIP